MQGFHIKNDPFILVHFLLLSTNQTAILGTKPLSNRYKKRYDFPQVKIAKRIGLPGK